MLNRWFLELIFPCIRIKRIERELDSDERLGIGRLKLEHYMFQIDNELENFKKPMLFVKYCK